MNYIPGFFFNFKYIGPGSYRLPSDFGNYDHNESYQNST